MQDDPRKDPTSQHSIACVIGKVGFIGARKKVLCLRKAVGGVVWSERTG
mgnify:FL=1